MSKRFGRNQRRRMREALHMAELAAEREYAGRIMAEGIARENSRKLEELREWRSEVIRMVGRSALIAGEPHILNVRYDPRTEGYVRVPIQRSTPRFDVTAISDLSMQDEVMRLLMVDVVQDDLRQQSIAQVELDETRVWMALSQHAIRRSSVDDLVALISRDMARQLAIGIKSKTR